MAIPIMNPLSWFMIGNSGDLGKVRNNGNSGNIRNSVMVMKVIVVT